MGYDMSIIKKGPGIIVALDMPDIDDAIRVAREVDKAKGNFVLKVGRILEMQYGINIISNIRSAVDMPIIYDGKIADIPVISSTIADMTYSNGADAVIVHGFVGMDVIQKIIDLEKGDVIVVVEMTHPGWTGFDCDLDVLISEMNVDGIVLPATHPESIREVQNLLGRNTYVIAPGVGTQGVSAGDAFSAGADYEIIGRTICRSLRIKDDAEYYYDWGLHWERERNHNF